ncbi:MAG: OmpA family protein [Opitutaceae bacterium]|nr:OmpA family protein [Cytophagales bacterium]
MKRQEKNFYLKKIEKGLTFTIRNILFKYNSHVLEKYSFWELDRIADILKDAPNLEVEIGGHTDNVGNDGYNLALSQRRAHSVVTYLVSKGVANVIHSKGYGEAKPIDTNLTPQGRGVNRRVEFVVLNVGEDPTLLYKPTELKPGQLPPPDIDPLKITQ